MLVCKCRICKIEWVKDKNVGTPCPHDDFFSVEEIKDYVVDKKMEVFLNGKKH